MAKARELFEAHPDEPEDFDVQGHLESPIARIARTNGFVRDDRSDSEERWVKKLRNGNAAWLRSQPYDPEDPPRDMRDPTRYPNGGRYWELIEVGPKGLKVLANGNEVTMTYLLGAILQRLATWPKGLPKPGQKGWQKAFEGLDDPEPFLKTFEPMFFVVTKVGPHQPKQTYWGGQGQPNADTGTGYWHAGPLEAKMFTQAEARQEMEYLIQNYVDLGRSREYGESRVGIELVSPKMIEQITKKRARAKARKQQRLA